MMAPQPYLLGFDWRAVVGIDVKVGDLQEPPDFHLIATTAMTLDEVIALSPEANAGLKFEINGLPVCVLLTIHEGGKP